MFWRASNFCPKTDFIKLAFAQKINWSPAFFCSKNVLIKKLELRVLAMQFLPFFQTINHKKLMIRDT